MAKDSQANQNIFQLRSPFGGISNFIKEDMGQQGDNALMYWYSQCLDTRTDPYALTLLPATQKESGSVITDLLKFADMTPYKLDTYAIGDGGNLYKRTSSGTWSLLGTAASSHGNGLQYFYGDDYVYYTQDSTIGRYGPTQGTPTLQNDFLTTMGSTPTNTNSLALASASSQYATAANAASLQITGSLTLEAYVNLTTLPAAGSSMSIVGKWDESGTLRSYLMDIAAISAVFGSGTDGSLTISSNTTNAPIDSACTGTISTYALSATNASFAAGQIILIHQTQGTNAGQYEQNVISSYTAGTITLQNALKKTYTTGAQVLVLKQYTNVTVNSGITWTAKAWNGTTGGILAFLANGTVTVTGNIVANGASANSITGASGGGFRGGNGVGGTNVASYQGESSNGVGIQSTANNGSAGGGGENTNASGGTASGGSAGHSVAGSNGYGNGQGYIVGTAGAIGTDSSDLTTFQLGAGGGGAGRESVDVWGGSSGGGGIMIFGVTISVTGTITANGGAANQDGNAGHYSAAGAGGSILLKAQTATLGTGLITANGGVASGVLPAGGNGRIALDYLTSYTGTTSPTANVLQDSGLVTTTTYQLRLHLSSDGTTNEVDVFNLASLSTGQWNRFSIAWNSSTKEIDFYQNASLLGTVTSTAGSISSNTSLLYVGANKGASTVGNFLNGKIDDVRVWSTNLSQTTTNTYLNQELTGNEGNLAAYYKLDNAATDSTANANNLTLQGAPSYSTSVPFSGATPLNIDQSNTTASGQTYTAPTSISETLANQLPFTPSFDPQSGIDLKIGAQGTGDVTVTIHDALNNVVATSTITHAHLASSGIQKFSFATPWRINIGHSYHAHVTSTTGDTTIVTSSANAMQSGGVATAYFVTYYQFLVTDTFSHPIMRWLNFLVIGNERYLATWDGGTLQPNLIAFPPGTHVRCLGTWGAYLVAGCWQEAITGTANVYDFPKGILYFWDGISLTFNFSIDVPEGQVNAVFGMDADLYYIAGWKADLMYYHGTFVNQSGAFNGTKVKRIPYLERSSYIETYPSAMTMWQGLLYFSMGGNSDSTKFPRNIYSWGTLYPMYPQSLTSDYVISTGNNGSTVNIGLVFPVGKKLLIGWKDGLAYGADIIDPNSGVYYKSGYLQSTIQDGGSVWHNDMVFKTRVDHLALGNNQTVSVGIYRDRSTILETTNSTTDTSGRFTVNPIENGRVYEYMAQMNVNGDGTSSPTILALQAGWNKLDTEQQF
ncbi:MAG TPA: LamG-like jellyroll fold domain-containing protein [Clostridia bacterium]